MKKKSLRRVFLTFLFALVSVFTLAACNNNESKTDDPYKSADDLGISETKESYELQDIALSGTYKTEFRLGEAFSADGMVVTATYKDTSTKDNKVVTEILSSDKYDLQSQDYLPDQVGTYRIVVSYTHEGITKSKLYEVTVSTRAEVYGGIVAKLTDGQTNEYTLSAQTPSVTISKDIVTVYPVDDHGKVGETPLAADKYTAQLYLGSKKIDGNVATENGVYSFTVISTDNPSSQDFINVYVSNPVSAIALKTDSASVFEQEQSSKDIISETWVFELTYGNGLTKTIYAGDAGLEIDIDTATPGQSKTATVTYTEADVAGTDHSVSCSVTYTITAKVITGDTVTYTLNYDAQSDNSFATSWGADTEDSQNNVAITNKCTTFKKDDSKYIKSTEDGSVSGSVCAEFKKGKEITIVVGEKATDVSIKAYISHSSSDDRTAFIGPNTDGSSSLATFMVGPTGANKNNLNLFEVTNVSAGTYYLSTLNDAGGNAVTMHIYKVVITYTVAVQTGGPQISYDPVVIDFTGLNSGAGDNGAEYTADSKDQIGTITLPQDGSVKGIDFILDTNPIKVKNSAQTIQHGTQSYSVTKTYSLQGTAGANKRSIKLTLDATLEYKITVYGKSSATNDSRHIAYSFDNFSTKETCSTPVNNTMVGSEFTFSGHDTVYFGSSNSGIDLYLIVVEVVQ